MKKILHFIFRIPNSGNKGTTLIELIIVVSIIAVISSISLLSLLSRKGQTDLTNTTQQMASILREARSRSASQSSSTSWGVHFENSTSTSPFYALFYSDSYSASTTVGYYNLPDTLVYGTSTIPQGFSKDIKFNQISGLASASTSIAVYLIRNGPLNSSTINVASSGAVSF